MKSASSSNYQPAASTAMRKESNRAALFASALLAALIAFTALALSMGNQTAAAAYAAESDDGALMAAELVTNPGSSNSVLQTRAAKAVPDIELYDLDGTTGNLRDVYQGKKYVVIAGRYSCGNTQNMVQQAWYLLDDPTYDDFSFLVFDIDNDYESFSDFGYYQDERLHFYTGADYNDWAWTTYVNNGGSYGSVSLPFLFAVNEEGNVLLAETGPCDMEEFIENALNPQTSDDEELQIVGPNVDYRTQEQIIERMAQDDVMLGVEDTFAVEPVFNTEMGELSEETKTLGLGMLNTVRYIAGLDDVVLDETYGDMAQAAAFVNDAIDIMTHNPASDASKPDGMSDEIWQLGCTGASKANLAAGFFNLSTAIVDGWMSDADCGNVSVVGHRRWCLNPTMAATGFGATNDYWKPYYAMYSMDNSGWGNQSNVVWPAQNMPYELFNYGDPWTISVGEAIRNPADVKVTLTRKSDNKTWTFEERSTLLPSSESEACFFIDDGLNGVYRGQLGCIIFRPDGVTYKAGDEFHVEATNVNGTAIVYDVKFFEGFPGQHPYDDPDDPGNGDDPDDPDDPDDGGDVDDSDDLFDEGYDIDWSDVNFPARYLKSNGFYVFTTGNSVAPTVTYDGVKVPASAYSIEYLDLDAGYKSVGSSFPKKPGYYLCLVTGKSPSYGECWTYIQVVKASNTLRAAAKSKVLTVKYKALKKKTQTIAAKKAFKVTGAKGKVTYAKVSGNKKITVSKAGKIKVKKGLKKGKTYKVKVKVTAAGNAYYKSATKTVTLKIKVK